MFADVQRRGGEIEEVKTDRWIWPVKKLTRGKMTLSAHRPQTRSYGGRREREWCHFDFGKVSS